MATRIKGKNKNKPYTTRYYFEGRQRERSFRTSAEEADFRAKFEHDSREQIFVDPQLGNQRFEDAANAWLARHAGAVKTKELYEVVLRLHIFPVFGRTPLAQLAVSRDAVERYLRETLPAKGLGPSVVRTCYTVLKAVVNDAVRSGKLNRSRLSGIKLPATPVKTEIPFASHQQIEMLASNMDMHGYGPTIWLMRGCGLRIGEALGIRSSDISGGSLRLSRQLAPNGQDYVPLKHREEGQFRDIPVPQYVYNATDGGEWDCPPISHRAYRGRFYGARDYAGLPASFTPHTLRHIFASNCLAGGIPITDVSKWLGHRSIQVTYGIYGHLVPASWDRARNVLDEEWSE